MKVNRVALWALVILSGLAVVCLALMGAALTDLWHMYGPRQIWTGTEPGQLEWRVVTLGYWSVVAFHLAWFGIAAQALLWSRTWDR